MTKTNLITKINIVTAQLNQINLYYKNNKDQILYKEEINRNIEYLIKMINLSV